MNPRLKGNLLVVGQFVLLALLVLSPTSNFPIAELAFIVPAISLTLMFLGAVILIIAFIGLGPALTAHPIPNKKARLQTGGLYKWVRHPIYLGLLLIALALTLTGGIFPQILYFIALYLLLNYKARFEEAQLSLRFSEYQAYAQKTGRFLPRLKR